MKDPEKVETGKRLTEHNCRKREEHTQLAKAQSESNITYYGAGAVVAIEVLGFIGYCIYQSKTQRERLLFTNPNQSSDILQHSQNRPTGDRWLKL